MRILVDTNVFIGAFLAHGTCEEVLDHCFKTHEVIASDFILGEFRRTLDRKFHTPVEDIDQAVELLTTRLRLVEQAPISEDAVRDPDDVPILAAAVAGQCDCLVTGDRDLLDLKTFRGIRILSPADFLRFDLDQ